MPRACPPRPILPPPFSSGPTSTLTANSLPLYKDAIQLAGSVSYNSSTGTTTLAPAAALECDTIYVAMITTEVTDLWGHHLIIDYEWTFITLPFEVSTVNPAKDTKNVPVNTSVTATFSAPIKESTLTSSSFTLLKGTTPVTGS